MKRRQKLGVPDNPQNVPPIRFRNPNERKLGREERMTPMNWRMFEIYVADPSIGVYGAYKKAGYKARGISGENSASQIFRKVGFQRELEKVRSERLKTARMSADELMMRVDSGIRVNPKWYFNEDGTLKKVHDLSDEAADALASLETVEIGSDGQIIKIKLLNKVALMKLSAQEKGLLTDKVEVTQSQPCNLIVEVSQEVYEEAKEEEKE